MLRSPSAFLVDCELFLPCLPGGLVARSMDLRRRVKAPATWHYRRSVIAVIYLFVRGREGIDVKAIRVQEVGQLLTPVNIYSLLESKLSPDLE